MKIKTSIRMLGSLMLVLSLYIVNGRAASASFSDTMPSSNVFLSTARSSANSNQALRNIGTGATDDRWIGDSFKVSSAFVLDKITLALSGNTEAQYTAVAGTTASIRIMDMGLTSYVAYNGSVSTAGILQADTVALPVSLASGFLTFDITDMQLNAGSNYAFVISLDGAGVANRQINVFFSNSSGVAYSFMSYDDGVTYTSTGAPLEFYLQGSAGVIPEPSASVIFVGLAALVAGIVIRRRRV